MSSCRICGHDHDYEGGQICSVCGHRRPATPAVVSHSFPQLILEPYLFLGSFNEAYTFLYRGIGARPYDITHVLNVRRHTHFLNVEPDFRGLGSLADTLVGDINSQFDVAFEYIRECEVNGKSVLVHCISGNNRSAAIVVAYLMKRKSWRLQEALGWVSRRRQQINIKPDLMQRLEEYEQRIFPNDTSNGIMNYD